MVLGYLLIGEVVKYTGWLSGLLTAGLVMRCARDLIEAYGDPETGVKSTLKKIKRRIFAALIGIMSTSLIALFKRYYM